VLLDRAVWDFCRPADLVPAAARVERRTQSLVVTIAESRPPKALAHRPRSFEASFRSLAYLFAFELGERGECCQQDVANEFVVGL
jgi:hypothetical protein